ncbi:MAG: UDP-N-acetylglucosamine 1-carboxyvinyltransferase [Anaerovoracaceae bacterium]
MLESYEIEGGIPLRGEYRVKGAKNSALPILAATVCRGAVYEIYDCPRIGDVFAMEEILNSMGAKTRWEKDCIIVDSRGIIETSVPKELMAEMRSSVFLMGSLLARSDEAVIYRPGGCNIGKRPIDIHISGLEQLGFEVTVKDEEVSCRGICKGGKITLPYPSVGATENLMMAALAGESDTIIENCAVEPEIKDLQGFLRTCGFQVYGAGTDTIFVKGARGAALCERPQEVMYSHPRRQDRGGDIWQRSSNRRPGRVQKHQSRIYIRDFEMLRKDGSRVRAYENTIEVGLRRLKSPGMIITQPYPGFPTDFQPQILTLSTVAKGLTTIREEVFESRFTHKNDLLKMGADIEICGKNAIIKGVEALCGAEVYARDLRGGAALVLAGLMAEGRTVVNDTFHIHRGYEDFEKGIKDLGGLIEKKREERKKEEKI